MRKGRSSLTAAYVAFLRALGDGGLTSVEGFRDPIAWRVLPSRWAGAIGSSVSKVATLSRRARERMIALIDLFIFRGLAVDAELTAAVAAGCQQVVILGAGFDGRAHRMPALASVRVFEVDHPATQSAKRRRVSGLERTCRELVYVACDFERDRLDERLESAGHRADEPTVWICEGVTLYLADDALHATLATIAERSAAKSTLVVDYHDAKAPTAFTCYSFVRKILLALWSEPQIGARSQGRMREELQRAGLRLEKDFSLSEWGAAFAPATPMPHEKGARLAVAMRAL